MSKAVVTGWKYRADAIRGGLVVLAVVIVAALGLPDWASAEDTTPPETTITSGPSGVAFSTSATFEFSSSKYASRFECRLDSQAWQTCTSPKSYATMPYGSHTFWVRATDTAGNVEATPDGETWESAAEAGGASVAPSISSDGRYVAFASSASNLVGGDTNGVSDIFVRDRTMLTTTRVSLGPSATQANGASSNPSVSADGRYVAFESSASNLSPNDTNSQTDVFVYDRSTGATRRASVGLNGQQLTTAAWWPPNYRAGYDPSISGDGRYVAFVTQTNNGVPGYYDKIQPETYVYDSVAGKSVDHVTAGSWTGNSPAISADGRYVAFRSTYFRLYSGDPGESGAGIYRYDRATKATARVTVTTQGAPANGESSSPSISGDGQRVAFASKASNLSSIDVGTNGLQNVFVRDLALSRTVELTRVGDGPAAAPSISADGRYVAFEWEGSGVSPVGDHNGVTDIYEAGVDSDGLGSECCVRLSYNYGQYRETNAATHAPSVSANGRYAAFASDASNLTRPTDADANAASDVFVHVFHEDHSHCDAIDRESLTHPAKASAAAAALYAAYLTVLNARDAAEQTTTHMRGCGEELFHYTRKAAADGIYQQQILTPPLRGRDPRVPTRRALTRPSSIRSRRGGLSRCSASTCSASRTGTSAPTCCSAPTRTAGFVRCRRR